MPRPAGSAVSERPIPSLALRARRPSSETTPQTRTPRQTSAQTAVVFIPISAGLGGPAPSVAPSAPGSSRLRPPPTFPVASGLAPPRVLASPSGRAVPLRGARLAGALGSGRGPGTKSKGYTERKAVYRGCPRGASRGRGPPVGFSVAVVAPSLGPFVRLSPSLASPPSGPPPGGSLPPRLRLSRAGRIAPRTPSALG